jgi:GGDEF domain-containing protein
MFADILQKLPKDIFIGHIGGDDFFVGFTNETYEEVYSMVDEIQANFAISAKSLYSKEDVANGSIMAKDRFGILRNFELLTVSAGIIEIKSDITNSFDDILGSLKKSSKFSCSPVGISIID